MSKFSLSRRLHTQLDQHPVHGTCWSATWPRHIYEPLVCRSEVIRRAFGSLLFEFWTTKTGYTDWRTVRFSAVPPGKSQQSTLKQGTMAPFHKHPTSAFLTALTLHTTHIQPSMFTMALVTDLLNAVFRLLTHATELKECPLVTHASTGCDVLEQFSFSYQFSTSIKFSIRKYSMWLRTKLSLRLNHVRKMQHKTFLISIAYGGKLPDVNISAQ